MMHRQFLLYISSCLLFLIGCSCTSTPKKPQGATYYGMFGGKKVVIPNNTRPLPIRGTWVVTAFNSSLPVHSNAQEYRKDIDALFDQLASRHVNTVFFQVRSACDAFYPSQLNPWSRFLAGKEGQGIPGLDPMLYALTAAHKRKMQFHAWFNPYRVGVFPSTMTTSQAVSTLSPNHIARLHPEYVLSIPMTTGAGKSAQFLFLNPGIPQVRNHVICSIGEILQHYAVDGIHLDDYFYPSTTEAIPDAQTCIAFNPQRLPLAEWRRQNNDMLVRGISTLVRQTAQKQRRPIQFGISPSGIWANNEHIPGGSHTRGLSSYSQLYANSRLWIQKGWIDYIVPQLYWKFDTPQAAFAGLVEWWNDQTAGTDVKLYIGLALYQAAPGGPWYNTAEINNQMKFIRSYPNVQGECFFSSKNIPLLPQRK